MGQSENPFSLRVSRSHYPMSHRRSSRVYVDIHRAPARRRTRVGSRGKKVCEPEKVRRHSLRTPINNTQYQCPPVHASNRFKANRQNRTSISSRDEGRIHSESVEGCAWICGLSLSTRYLEGRECENEKNWSRAGGMSERMRNNKRQSRECL